MSLGQSAGVDRKVPREALVCRGGLAAVLKDEHAHAHAGHRGWKVRIRRDGGVEMACAECLKSPLLPVLGSVIMVVATTIDGVHHNRAAAAPSKADTKASHRCYYCFRGRAIQEPGSRWLHLFVTTARHFSSAVVIDYTRTAVGV